MFIFIVLLSLAFNVHLVESRVDGGFVEVFVFIAFVDLVWSGVHGACHFQFPWDSFAFARIEAVIPLGP